MSLTISTPAFSEDGYEPAARRRTELTMLIFVIGIVGFAYASVGFGLKGRIPSSLFLYVGAFAVIMLAAHLAVRRFAPYADPLLLPLAALLNGLGVVMIYRLGQAGRNGNPGCGVSLCPDSHGTLYVAMSTSAVLYQIFYTAIGVGCLVGLLALVKEPRTLQRYTYTFGAIGVFLIALPAVLPSSISAVPDTSAKIQIRLGSFSVQPEEFAKLALAVF